MQIIYFFPQEIPISVILLSGLAMLLSDKCRYTVSSAVSETWLS